MSASDQERFSATSHRFAFYCSCLTQKSDYLFHKALNRMAFAVIIPSRAPIAPQSFIQLDQSIPQWIVTLEQPSLISEICVALTQPLASSDLGVGISFGVTIQESVEFLGLLTNLRPSDIFSTGWPWTINEKVPSLQLVLTIETASSLLEKIAAKPPLDVKKELARRTALNLFRFIESYSESGSQALLTDPVAVLDRWFRRFEEKYKIDPNFMLKSE